MKPERIQIFLRAIGAAADTAASKLCAALDFVGRAVDALKGLFRCRGNDGR